MNTERGVVSSLKKSVKVMILIFSMAAAAALGASCWYAPRTYAAEAAQGESAVVTTDAVATAGDAGYLTTPRTLTDVYNVLVLILLILVMWVFWNLMRTLIRILVDFKHY